MPREAGEPCKSVRPYCQLSSDAAIANELAAESETLGRVALFHLG
jgi:hypothetical protein